MMTPRRDPPLWKGKQILDTRNLKWEGYKKTGTKDGTWENDW